MEKRKSFPNGSPSNGAEPTRAEQSARDTVPASVEGARFDSKGRVDTNFVDLCQAVANTVTGPMATGFSSYPTNTSVIDVSDIDTDVCSNELIMIREQLSD